MSDSDATQTEDEALAALKRLFNRDNQTVEADDGVMGDYKVTLSGCCIHESNKKALSSLGFQQGSTHSHIIEHEDSENEVEMTLYLYDTQGDA